MINSSSLEVFKTNFYTPHEIGNVSNNAYLSIVTTNACQRKCQYCINSETDSGLELPIDAATKNIKALVDKYAVKEAILLGGEPTLHSNLFELLKQLRVNTGLSMIRLTTNGIALKDSGFVYRLVNKDYGIQGINISYHNEDFVTLSELEGIVRSIKNMNPDIKVRINTNIWTGNNDNLPELLVFLDRLSFVDEIRISNLIPKDSFSVNAANSTFMGLSIDDYNNLFQQLCAHYSNNVTLIENEKTLGFVRYVLIPKKVPLIINWNTQSTVSEQVCENDYSKRQINTFKCLVDGRISLSWNENNVITL